MKAILARQWNHAFSLLRYEPIVAHVAGTDHMDIYVKAGDPIGWRNMCEAATAALLGVDLSEFGSAVGSSIEVEAFIIPRACMTAELKALIRRAQKGHNDCKTFADFKDDVHGVFLACGVVDTGQT